MVAEDLVLWKPLYYTSIVLFILSLVLFPLSSQWSIVTILILLSLWTRIPGFVHFVFNKLAMNDMFTLVVAANLGGLVGGLFGAFTMIFSKIFGTFCSRSFNSNDYSFNWWGEHTCTLLV